MSTSLRFGASAALAASAWLVACGGETGGSPGTGTAGATSGGSTNGTTATASLLVGTYSKCQWLSAEGSGGGAFVTPPASVTIAAQGSSLLATFTNASGDAPTFQALPATSTLTLAATSASSAQLQGAGQGYPNLWAYCGGGAFPTDAGSYVISDPAPTTATLTANSVDAVADGDMLFVTMEGPLTNIVGSADCPADSSTEDSTGTLVCLTRTPSQAAPTGPTSTSGATVASSIAAGTYTCSGSIGAVCGNLHESAGTSGSLVVAEQGGAMTSTYSGSYGASGALQLATAGSTSATVLAGQSFTVDCGLDASDPPPFTAPVTAGALTLEGQTLTLAFASPSTDSEAEDSPMWGALTCTPASP